MIKFDAITDQYFTDASFEVGRGSVCNIIAGSNEDKDAALKTMLGLSRPDAGKVSLLGVDVYSASDASLTEAYGRLGVAWVGGGLISNLCVWENIMLPLGYHLGKRPEDVEDRVVSMLVRLGMDKASLPEYMAMRPGLMPVHEKSIAGLVRAMMMEPELIIYDSILDDMKPEAASRVLELAAWFHAGREGRTSVFMGAGDAALAGVKADVVIRRAGRGFMQ